MYIKILNYPFQRFFFLKHTSKNHIITFFCLKYISLILAYINQNIYICLVLAE